MAGHNSKEVDLQPPKGCLLVCFSFSMNSEQREYVVKQKIEEKKG